MYSKTKIYSKKFKVIATLLLCSLFSISANAQCAMCRAALTSEGNTTKAAAINDGIVYLMAIPYILVAIIGYIVYRMKTKKAT
ncbi:hypothetical protein LNP27_05985 [Flavobacterium galactosidilyticum]|nr:hypothetical protein [Flavobacterium sp. F-340]UFH47584.1 hypothetical protein LNP27_05985 [Flavobacterium sp. F-340]